MASQYGIKYAVHLVTNQFGNLVAQVCECLLNKGPLNLESIVRYTTLPASKVKNSLLVLIQHNCVQAFQLSDEGGGGEEAPKIGTQYIALFANIIHRSRFEKFLAIVKREFDQSCYDLVEGLMQHGRLTLEQLAARGGQSTQVKDPNATRENLSKLVRAHYIERCPRAEPIIGLPTEEEEAPARKRGAKAAKKVAEPETLEQRILAAAVPIEAIRFSVPTNGELDTDGASSMNCLPGEKRKHDDLESNLDVDNDEERVVLWRPNFEEFICQLRHKACIENVRTRMDNQAAIILSAMLEASKNEEKRVKAERSVPLSVNLIYEEVIKSEEGRNMTIDIVKATLVELSSPVPFIRVVDESYVVDFKHIIEVARTAEVESIVLKRYGRDAYRMFRFLSKTGCLTETDKIADTTFVEKKDTTKHLYKMWQDGYLLMEKLMAGPKQFLLWKVNKPSLWAHVLDEMFHAALNLSKRFDHEKELAKEILANEKMAKYRKVQVLLYSSRVKLDDAIMLFHDF